MKYIYILLICLILFYIISRYFEKYYSQENFDPSLVPVSSIITLAKVAQKIVDGNGTLTNPANLNIGTPTGKGNLLVTGETILSGGLSVADIATVGSNLSVNGATNFNNSLRVAGSTTLNNSLSVTGGTNVGGALGVTGNTNVGGALGVTGNTNLNTLGVTSNTTLNKGLTITAGGANITNGISTDGLVVNGNTNISGVTNLKNGLTVTGNADISGDLKVGGVTLTGGDIGQLKMILGKWNTMLDFTGRAFSLSGQLPVTWYNGTTSSTTLYNGWKV